MKFKKSLILLALAGTVFGLSAGLTKDNVSNMVIAAGSSPLPHYIPAPPQPPHPQPEVSSFTINYILPIDEDRVFYNGEIVTNQDFKGELYASANAYAEATTYTFNPLIESMSPFNDTADSGVYPTTIGTQLASGINNLAFCYANTVSNQPLYNLELNVEDRLFNYKKLKKITSIDDINDEDIYYFATENNDYTFLFDRRLEPYSYAETVSSFTGNSHYDCIIRNKFEENNSQYLLASREMHDNLIKLKFENIDRSESGLLRNVNVYSESVSFALYNSGKYDEHEITGKTYFVDEKRFSHNYSYNPKRDYTVSFRDNKAVLMTSGGWINHFGVVEYSTHFWPKMEIISSEDDRYDTAGITVYKLDFTLDDLAEEFNDEIDNNCSHYGIVTSNDLDNIKKAWENAVSDYKTLLKDSEKERISETQGEIGTMLSKYDYILYTYGSTLGLENFLEREIVEPQEEPEDLTAEDIAKEFNDNIDLYCNGGINPVLTGENSVASAWAKASEQYSKLSGEEKAKFNVDGSSSTTITDLTGYTWVPNNTISWPGAITYNVNATLYSEGGDEDTTEILKFYTQQFPDAILQCLGVTNGSSKWYTFAITGPIYQLPNTKGSYVGTSNQFKQMIFTGGTDATNATLIEWLQANGTLTKETPEVDPEIQEFLNKYDYLYQKYGNNTSMNLDNFLSRDVTPLNAKNNIINEAETSTSWIVVAISLIGVTTIGAFFLYRKRKEN